MPDTGNSNRFHLLGVINLRFLRPSWQGSADHLLRQALEERAYLPYDNVRQAACLTAEDTIASKLKAFAESRSTRHLDDVRSIIRIQGDALDAAAIDATAARLGALGVWGRGGLWTRLTGPGGKGALSRG